MYRKYIVVALCFLSVLFPSCIKPLEEEGIYESTRCYGVVMDSRTHQPLEGLRVMATDGSHVGNVVYSAANGMFEIAVTLDQLSKGYGIRFESDSLYESLVYNLADVPLGTKEFDMGEVYLVGPSLPMVSATGIVDITAISAHCYGTIDNEGNSTIVEQGFVYSTMQYPTVDNYRVSASLGGDDFDCVLDLEPHTTYYVRAYAVNAMGIGYSDQLVVTTLDGLAEVATGSVSNVTTTSATCGGTVHSDGGFAVLSRGICWSTSAQPSIYNAHTNNGSGIGSFVGQMSSLEPNTTYHVRAWAENSSGVSYGSEIVFTTQSGLPTVTTTPATDVTSTSAVAGGVVTADGGYPVIRRGVCYGTSALPTIAGLHTTDGAGTGSFVSQLTNLTPGSTYYYRAYATNGVGTVYGEQQLFVAW
ncbi:MAG: hypothetical protein IJK84_02395 [Bacteroidales bacterium]|nr:hypothetical protein [Bacteroidales bacterium]